MSDIKKIEDELYQKTQKLQEYAHRLELTKMFLSELFNHIDHFDDANQVVHLRNRVAVFLKKMNKKKP